MFYRRERCVPVQRNPGLIKFIARRNWPETNREERYRKFLSTSRQNPLIFVGSKDGNERRTSNLGKTVDRKRIILATVFVPPTLARNRSFPRLAETHGCLYLDRDGCSSPRRDSASREPQARLQFIRRTASSQVAEKSREQETRAIRISFRETKQRLLLYHRPRNVRRQFSICYFTRRMRFSPRLQRA